MNTTNNCGSGSRRISSSSRRSNPHVTVSTCSVLVDLVALLYCMYWKQKRSGEYYCKGGYIILEEYSTAKVNMIAEVNVIPDVRVL